VEPIFIKPGVTELDLKSRFFRSLFDFRSAKPVSDAIPEEIPLDTRFGAPMRKLDPSSQSAHKVVLVGNQPVVIVQVS
jgi:hypothetical protein